MAQYCGDCIHCKCRCYKFCTGQKNVSGGLAWYDAWSKFRCEIRKCQEKKNYRCKFFVGNEKYKKQEEKYRKWREEFDREIEEYNICVGTK